MKTIYNNIIPFKGFTAMNLFGVLFVRKGKKISKIMLNHETIHTSQMKEMLYIPFYIWYIIEYIIRVFQYRFKLHTAYRNISFEREAYANQYDVNYVKNRESFNWINYI